MVCSKVNFTSIYGKLECTRVQIFRHLNFIKLTVCHNNPKDRKQAVSGNNKNALKGKAMHVPPCNKYRSKV
jgi:hypothetical protein